MNQGIYTASDLLQAVACSVSHSPKFHMLPVQKLYSANCFPTVSHTGGYRQFPLCQSVESRIGYATWITLKQHFRALILVPSLRSGHYSPGAFGFLNCIDPLVSVSNYYVMASWSPVYMLWRTLIKLFKTCLLNLSWESNCTLAVTATQNPNWIMLNVLKIHKQ